MEYSLNDALPCPFCGKGEEDGDLSLGYNGPGPPPSYFVVCEWCGAEGPHGHGSQRGDDLGGQRDAVKRWNHRPAILGK